MFCHDLRRKGSEVRRRVRRPKMMKNASSPESPTRAAPSAGRFGATYGKRRTLKTQFINDEKSRAEIMGQGRRLAKKGRDDSDDDDEAEDDDDDDAESAAKTLKKLGLVSQTLLRL